jgi:hypothetical protein
MNEERRRITFQWLPYNCWIGRLLDSNYHLKIPINTKHSNSGVYRTQTKFTGTGKTVWFLTNPKHMRNCLNFVLLNRSDCGLDLSCNLLSWLSSSTFSSTSIKDKTFFSTRFRCSILVIKGINLKNKEHLFTYLVQFYPTNSFTHKGWGLNNDPKLFTNYDLLIE